MLNKRIKLLSLTEAIEEFIVISHMHRCEKLWVKAVYRDNISTGLWQPNQIYGYEKSEINVKFYGRQKKLLRERIYYLGGKEILSTAIKIFNQTNNVRLEKLAEERYKQTFKYRVGKAINDNIHLIKPYLHKETL